MAIWRVLPHFTPQAVSNVVWALAWLGVKLVELEQVLAGLLQQLEQALG